MRGEQKFRIGVLGSGKGSNFAAIADLCAAGTIPAEIAIVLSDVADVYAAESEDASYFDSLAPILGSAALPDRLRAALFTLETAAASESRERLDSAIQRRIPCVSLADCCPLDCALELWFHAPEELSQFQTVEASPSPPAPRSLSGQEERVRGEEAISEFPINSPPSPNPKIQKSIIPFSPCLA